MSSQNKKRNSKKSALKTLKDKEKEVSVTKRSIVLLALWQ